MKIEFTILFLAFVAGISAQNSVIDALKVAKRINSGSDNLVTLRLYSRPDLDASDNYESAKPSQNFESRSYGNYYQQNRKDGYDIYVRPPVTYTNDPLNSDIQQTVNVYSSNYQDAYDPVAYNYRSKGYKKSKPYTSRNSYKYSNDNYELADNYGYGYDTNSYGYGNNYYKMKTTTTTQAPYYDEYTTTDSYKPWYGNNRKHYRKTTTTTTEPSTYGYEEYTTERPSYGYGYGKYTTERPSYGYGYGKKYHRKTTTTTPCYEEEDSYTSTTKRPRYHRKTTTTPVYEETTESNEQYGYNYYPQRQASYVPLDNYEQYNPYYPSSDNKKYYKEYVASDQRRNAYKKKYNYKKSYY